MILQLEHSSGREDIVGIPEPMGILDGHGDAPVKSSALEAELEFPWAQTG